MTPWCILVVDDHPVFRLGMVALLRSRWPSATILEEDGTRPIQTRDGAPQVDLAIVDHRLGPLDGLTLLDGLVASGAKVVMVSMDDDLCASEIARARGASGWMRKDWDASRLVSLVEKVFQGESLWKDPAKRLSPMEKVVLDALSRKDALPDVASKLGVSYSTLNTHKRRLFRKLGILPDF